jgi:arabinan endo-1,5-alpha-L-arabinosidase
MIQHILLGLLIVILLTACRPVGVGPTTTSEAVIKGTIIEPEGFIDRVHDPVIAHEADTYYVFSTGSRIPFICSKDKVVWEFCGRVFEKNPVWTREVNPNLGDIWAPDISFFNNQWHLYYAVSSFGSQDSAIGLATNAALDPNSSDYQWVDQGEVLRSRPGDQWNAIDANLVLDENGEPWLAWGSFWQGIWMRKIDSSTGKFAENDSTYHHLADRSTGPDNTSAIEAPFIISREGKWYLFVSFDKCCQGNQSTYNVRVGRSDTLKGPYIDRNGVPLIEGGGTLTLSAYDKWIGPGHNGILLEDGAYWMAYHAYAASSGISSLRIESLSWDAEGWPSLPSQIQKP